MFRFGAAVVRPARLPGGRSTFLEAVIVATARRRRRRAAAAMRRRRRRPCGGGHTVVVPRMIFLDSSVNTHYDRTKIMCHPIRSAETRGHNIELWRDIVSPQTSGCQRCFPRESLMPAMLSWITCVVGVRRMAPPGHA